MRLAGIGTAAVAGAVLHTHACTLSHFDRYSWLGGGKLFAHHRHRRHHRHRPPQPPLPPQRPPAPAPPPRPQLRRQPAAPHIKCFIAVYWLKLCGMPFGASESECCRSMRHTDEVASCQTEEVDSWSMASEPELSKAMRHTEELESWTIESLVSESERCQAMRHTEEMESWTRRS